MKICIMNNLYKPYNRGGADRIAEIIAEGLDGRGHEVFVISTKPREKFSIFNFQFSNNFQLVNDKIKIYHLSSLFYNLNKIPVFFRLFWHITDMFDVVMFFRIRNILKREKPGVVISNNLKGLGFLVPLAIKSLGIKHIHVLHDIQLIHPSGLMILGEEKKVESSFAKFYSYLNCKLFGLPSVVISPSKWLMELHERKGFFRNSKKLIMPNPINLVESRKSKVESHNENNSKSRLLFVGQIEDHKGVDLMIEAFLSINNDAIDLGIVGPGSKLEQIKKEYGEIKNLKIYGRMDSSKVKELMHEYDCLIVPSLCYENSPTVIYEAYSCGLPVLAAGLGGIPEIINKYGGFLFEPGNPEDLQGKIEMIAEMDREEFRAVGEKAREGIRGLRVDIYLDKLEELFMG